MPYLSQKLSRGGAVKCVLFIFCVRSIELEGSEALERLRGAAGIPGPALSEFGGSGVSDRKGGLHYESAGSGPAQIS